MDNEDKPSRTCYQCLTVPITANRRYKYCSDECSTAARLERQRVSASAYYYRNREECIRKTVAARAADPNASAKRRLRKYGFTQETYDAQMAAQGARCAICQTDNPGNHWAIDHDHGCCPGKKSCGTCVRGLLCITCNLGLGAFRDSPASLRSAVSYLEGWANG